MAPRSFVFVSADMARAFREEWREIDRRFPALSEAPEDMPLDEHWRNLAMLREAARTELRQALRQAAQLGHEGIYAIPV